MSKRPETHFCLLATPASSLPDELTTTVIPLDLVLSFEPSHWLRISSLTHTSDSNKPAAMTTTTEQYYSLDITRTDGQGYNLTQNTDESATAQEVERWRIILAKLMKVELAPHKDSELMPPPQ